MKALYHFLAVTLLASVSASIADEVNFWCENSGGGCQLAWDMSEYEKVHHYVERFNPKQRSWEVTREKSSTFGVIPEFSEPGAVYRVRACNSDGTACELSEAVWVPVVPDSADEIPERTLDHLGRGMRVSKDEPLVSQTVQYNVYLLAAAMGGQDGRGFPPMRAQFFRGDYGTNAVTTEDHVHLVVQQQYELIRAHLMGEGREHPYEHVDGAGNVEMDREGRGRGGDGG